MNWRRLWLVLPAAFAAMLWWPSQKRRPRPAAAPGTAQSPPESTTAARVDLTKHDGATLDFSNGQPVVKDSPGEKAAIKQAGKELDEEAKDVTFRPTEPANTDKQPTKR
jgi:hypothetical protein